MENETTRAQLEKQLLDRRESIDQRIDTLEGELVSAPASIINAVTVHPVVGLAGVVAAGLAVGLLVRRRRKRRSKSAPIHQELIEKYIDAVGEEVRRMIKRGSSPDSAVRKALQDRVPIIFYAPDTVEPKHSSKGFLRESVDIALTTALGFAVKTAVDFFTARLNVQELQETIALENDMRRTAGESVPSSHSGDGSHPPPPAGP